MTKSKYFQTRKQYVFLVLIFAAVVIGIALGCSLHPGLNANVKLNRKQLYFLEFPGMIFIRMMNLFVVPLAVCSNISSLSSISHQAVGYMSLLAFTFFSLGTFSAATISTFLALLIKPGSYGTRQVLVNGTESQGYISTLKADQTILNVILNLVPDNAISACFRSTDLHIIDGREDLNLSVDSNSSDIQIFTTFSDKPNIFGLFCFSILFGLGLQQVSLEHSQHVSELFDSSRKALLWCITVLLWTFPVGIISLISYRIVLTKNLAAALVHLGVYTLTSLLALGLQLIFLMLLYFLLTRKSPFGLVYDIFQAIACGIGTASSVATLPVTLSCLAKSSHVDNTVVRFLLPLGTTLNMNGTAVVETIAPIFILQVMERPIGISEVANIIFGGMLVSAVSGSVPSGGLISMTITLGTLGKNFGKSHPPLTSTSGDF